MKKAISSLLLSAMMLTSAQPLQINAASSELELTTRCELLSAPETVDGIRIPAGSMKVSVIVTNNKTSFSNCGIAIPCDPDYIDPFRDKNGEILYTTGCEWDTDDGLYHIKPILGYNIHEVKFPEKNKNKKGCLPFVFAGDWKCKQDGNICTVYFKAKTEKQLSDINVNDLFASPRVDKINDSDNKPVPYKESNKIEYIRETPPPKGTYTTVTKYTYLLGNVNGDDEFGVDDAQAICIMLGDKENIKVDSPDFKFSKDNMNFKGLFFKLGTDDVLDLSVADVDGDKDVDMRDAQLILHYCTIKSSGLSPEQCGCKKCKDGKNINKEQTGNKKLYS